jgi:hypothetical protein
MSVSERTSQEAAVLAAALKTDSNIAPHAQLRFEVLRLK